MFRESAPPALTATRPQSPKPGQGAFMSTARFPLPRSWRRLAIGVAALLLGYLALVTPSAHAALALLSQGRPTTASSTENAGSPASAATDGNDGTRWSSAFTDPQWLQVDLGSAQQITQVGIHWETARAATFKIQVSNDGNAWTDASPVTNGA